MTDGKKPDAPGAVPPPVPDANLKATTPYYPSPAQLKDARKPEYANTVIAPNPPPTPFELSKTQPSMANPVLAKLQAEERATAERAAAQRATAEREAAERAANERLVAERAASTGARPAAVPDRSLLATDPMRQAPPPAAPTAAQQAAAAAKAQALRQQLGSRPVAAVPAPPAPPRPPDVITEPVREAVPRPGQPPGIATVVQRPPAPPPPAPLGQTGLQPKTDPMHQPDVAAAMARPSKVAIPPPPPAPARKPVPPWPLADPTQVRPVGAPPPGPAPVRPLAPLPAIPPLAERTDVRPLPPAPAPAVAATAERKPPGVPMPPSAERTEVRPIPAAPPGVPMPASAERTEIRAAPAPAAAPTDVGLKPFHDGPKITPQVVAPRPAPLPQVTAPPREVTPLPDLTPLPPKAPSLTAAPATPVSQQDLTPVPPQPALADAPPGETREEPSRATPPPSNRPPLVVPPSFMDLPPAMEKPKRIDAGWLTTQPNLAGPFATQPSARPPSVDTEPDPDKAALAQTGEEVPSSDVMATPAGLWRRAFAWILDGAVLGAMIGGTLFLATGALVSKPVPNGLHGFDAFLFRVAQIAIPALAVSIGLAVLYTVAGAVLLKGRTLGRLLAGIRLVDSTGQRPGVMRALIRAVFSLVSFALFLSGFWLALFDRRGQTLHDKLTRTFVIRPV